MRCLAAAPLGCAEGFAAVLAACGRAPNSPSRGRHLAARAACARCSNRRRSSSRLKAIRCPARCCAPRRRRCAPSAHRTRASSHSERRVDALAASLGGARLRAGGCGGASPAAEQRSGGRGSPRSGPARRLESGAPFRRGRGAIGAARPERAAQGTWRAQRVTQQPALSLRSHPPAAGHGPTRASDGACKRITCPACRPC